MFIQWFSCDKTILRRALLLKGLQTRKIRLLAIRLNVNGIGEKPSTPVSSYDYATVFNECKTVIWEQNFLYLIFL